MSVYYSVLPVHKVQNGDQVFSIEKHIVGEWVKYNRNDGEILLEDDDNAQKVAAFSHYVFSESGGSAIALDLQGSYQPQFYAI